MNPIKFRRDITLAEAGDIMIAALEGGIGYWSVADEIVSDAVSGGYLRYRLQECAGEDVAPGTKFVVTQEKVKEIWQQVADQCACGQLPFCSDYVAQMVDAAEEPGDAGCVDAGVADCLVQLVCFGEVVYG